MVSKKKVAIIFGGQSTEHEVSLKSATTIINNTAYKRGNTPIAHGNNGSTHRDKIATSPNVPNIGERYITADNLVVQLP